MHQLFFLFTFHDLRFTFFNNPPIEKLQRSTFLFTPRIPRAFAFSMLIQIALLDQLTQMNFGGVAINRQ